MNKLRIFLADDHMIVREGLKGLINAQADMEVVGEAENGIAALKGAIEQGSPLSIKSIVRSQAIRKANCLNARAEFYAPRTNELFERLVAEGTPFEIEKRYKRKDGSIIWVHIGAFAIRNDEGKPELLLHLLTLWGSTIACDIKPLRRPRLQFEL